jgi:hypothetical protein
MAKEEKTQLAPLGEVKIVSLMLNQPAEGCPRSFVVGNPGSEDMGMVLEIIAKNAFWFIRGTKKNFVTNAQGAAVFK